MMGGMTPLPPGITKFFYVNEELAVLNGAVSVPLDTRVEIGTTDYVVNRVRISVRANCFDLYYECHKAEVTGSEPDVR
ncbi:MAG: hypothetical protein WCD35_16665 [Mycobacteriales bacterium]